MSLASCLYAVGLLVGCSSAGSAPGGLPLGTTGNNGGGNPATGGMGSGVTTGTPPATTGTPPLDGGLPPTADAGPAGETFTGDLTQMGPHAVSQIDVSVPVQSGDLTGSFYAPDDSENGGGPYPLVIVVPGFGASYPGYAIYSNHMASWGFVVLGINFTDAGNHRQSAQDILDAIDWAGSSSPLAAGVDNTRVATAGHSAGGKVAYYAAALDPQRIQAVIGWDPVNASGPPCDLGLFGAGDDPNAQCNQDPVAPNELSGQQGVLDMMSAKTLTFAAPVGAFNPAAHHAEFFFKGSPEGSLYVFFTEGSHLNWGVGGGENLESMVGKPTGAAWLLRHLEGMVGPDIDAHLPPTDSGLDVRTK